MTRPLNKLSARKVETLSKPGDYCDGGGLWLQISPSGSKSWLFRFTQDGKRRHFGLGSLISVGLSDARLKAQECRRKVASGTDPIHEKQLLRIARQEAKPLGKTFQQCTLELIETKRSGWKNAKHAQQWENTLATYAYPLMGDLPVERIDTGLVSDCLRPIWDSKTETATRVRQRIEAVLAYAKTMGYRQGDNPAAWKGHLDNVFAAPNKVTKREKQPALPHKQIAEFLDELRTETESISSYALEFTILTAARTSQTIMAEWSEFNLRERCWTVPAERMKADREHTIPLSERAITILQKLHGLDSKYVFPGGKKNAPLSTAAMDQRLKGLNEAREKSNKALWIDPKQSRPITVHGFRSTFRDWAAECTNLPAQVAEQALAHSLPDKVEAAYLRSDLYEKRKVLMDEWANYCRYQPSVRVITRRRPGFKYTD